MMNIWNYIPNLRGRPPRPWDGKISSLDLAGSDAKRRLKVAYHLLDICQYLQIHIEDLGIYDNFAIDNEA